MTIKEALAAGTAALQKHTCADTDPQRETESLLSFSTGKERTRLHTHPEEILTGNEERTFLSSVERRAAHEPLAHIIGDAMFLDLRIMVTKDTLIPRAATEALAELAIRLCAEKERPLMIDVGTGSGCIALAVSRTGDATEVIAIDRSGAALKVAEKNATELGVTDRIRFLEGDLLDPIEEFDADRPLIITANLPYIPAGDIVALPPEIRDHEPHEALDGGPDGLDPYRDLFSQMKALHAPKGTQVLIEILPEQRAVAETLVKEHYPESEIHTIEDAGQTFVGLQITT